MTLKTEEILELDCSKQENVELLDKFVRTIKPIGNRCENETGEIPLEILETFVHKMCKKYEVIPRWINFSKSENCFIYTAIFVIDTVYEGYSDRVYAKTIHELFSKMSIKLLDLKRRGILKEIGSKEEVE